MTGRSNVTGPAVSVGISASGAPNPDRLLIDPTKCTGISMCSFVAPDLITVDPWGYPILPAELDSSELGAARAAVAACPRKALAVATRQLRSTK